MPEWVDFKLVRQSVSMEQLLAHYAITLKRSNENYLRGNCPLPTHNSKSTGTFCVNMAKSLWTCKSDSCAKASGRKGGNLLDFVSLKEQCSLPEAARKILEWFPNGNCQPTADLVAKPESNVNQNSVLENKPLAWGGLKGISYCDYLKQRGITEETAAKFGVGFFPGKGSMAGRVVIPIHSETCELLAYAGRALDDTEPRYKLPDGFHKSLVLYNLHRLGDQVDIVIVVEGFFGAIWLTQCGFPNVVALMGWALSEEQERLLNFPKIILMLDGNETGQKATLDLLPRLAKNHFVRAIMLQPDQQPDSLAPPQLTELLGCL